MMVCRPMAQRRTPERMLAADRLWHRYRPQPYPQPSPQHPMSAPQPATPLLEQDHWITHANGRIHAHAWQPAGVADTRAPVVMLHDSLGAVALWRDFPALVARATQRRVIAYDRLGFGQSDARVNLPSAQFVTEEATDYFPALREQLGLHSFVLLGHSVGCGMAIEVAARAGDACKALITIAGQAFVEDRTLAGISEARETFKDPEQLARLARYHGDKARWVVDAWTETWLSEPFANWSTEASLPLIHCPVLAMHGEHDEYGSPIHPQLIADGVSGPAEAVVFDGAHHMPHREMPDVVVARIAQFLQGIA